MFPHGETITVWTEVTSRTGDIALTRQRQIRGVGIAPSTTPGLDSTESSGQRVQVTTGVTLFCPTGSDIDAYTRVRLPADPVTDPGGNPVPPKWRVVGDPGSWRSPLSGWAPGMVVELERVRG